MICYQALSNDLNCRNICSCSFAREITRLMDVYKRLMDVYKKVGNHTFDGCLQTFDGCLQKSRQS